jgi:hypothetical protein
MVYYKAKHILDMHESSVLNQLDSFGSKLARVMAELLYITLTKVRDAKKASTSSVSDMSSLDTLCRSILLALDHSRLESLVSTSHTNFAYHLLPRT